MISQKLINFLIKTLFYKKLIILLIKTYYFINTHKNINKTHYFTTTYKFSIFTKSSVLPREFMSFYKIIGFTKRIYDFL